MEGGIDGGQSRLVRHLGGQLVHVEVLGIDLLHILDHLIGDAEEGGINHIVLPQRHLTHVTLVEQRELLQEFLQSEHLSHLVQTVLVFADARLGVESVDKRIREALVVAAPHKTLQFTRFQHGIVARRILEDGVDLPQEQGLVASVGQFVDHKHVLALSRLLALSPFLDADRPHVD